MSTRFVCLANSYKEGGRCVAGIMLDKRNNPIMEGGLPKWIRPVSDTEHGEISEEMVAHFNLLDILELKVENYVGEGYQSENATFEEDSIQKIGTFDVGRLNKLCDERPALLASTAKAIHQDHIHRHSHSLTLVGVKDFEAYEQESEHHPGKQSLRLSFTHEHNQYDFPITDPIFKYNYQYKADYLDNVEQMLLTLSVGLPLNAFHFKLVAGVILIIR